VSDVLLATGAVLAWLSVLIDTARGSPPDGATRTFGRASNAVLGVLTRPFRRRWWRDVHVEVDPPSTLAQPDARWSSSVPFCTHRYPATVSNLCMRYGYPDDPSWAGDRR
jgi:hypothetical protein